MCVCISMCVCVCVCAHMTVQVAYGGPKGMPGPLELDLQVVGLSYQMGVLGSELTSYGRVGHSLHDRAIPPVPLPHILKTWIKQFIF